MSHEIKITDLMIIYVYFSRSSRYTPSLDTHWWFIIANPCCLFIESSPKEENMSSYVDATRSLVARLPKRYIRKTFSSVATSRAACIRFFFLILRIAVKSAHCNSEGSLKKLRTWRNSPLIRWTSLLKQTTVARSHNAFALLALRNYKQFLLKMISKISILPH